MKKLLVFALLCFIGVAAKSQSLRLADSYPAYNNDDSYATHPIVTLDSLGYLYYSFTVNYPMGTQRSDVEFGGTLITLGLVFDPYGSIEYVANFDNETWDYTTLPFGPITHSGFVYIGNKYANLRQVFISAGTGFSYFSSPYQYAGYSTYDEYDFIP